MKKFLLFIFFTFSVYANDLLQIYLKDGIKAVQNHLEAGLSNKDFWKEQIKNDELKYGYYSNDLMLIIVSKEQQKLYAYEVHENQLKQKFEQSVITGLMGDKKAEGDLKTPIGVYDVVKKIVPPDTYYGPYAFILSYPNLFDKIHKKTGSGIWIHGFPLEGDVRYDAYKTKGCVVMTNDILLDFENIIKDKKSIAIINEKGIITTNIDEISTILANLFAWKNAWTNNETDKYLSFYSDDFIKYDGTKIIQFKEQKRSIFSRKQAKEIRFSNINIIPYPNIENKKIFKITFFENYKTSTYSFNGEKVLYVELKNDKFYILAEQ